MQLENTYLSLLFVKIFTLKFLEWLNVTFRLSIRDIKNWSLRVFEKKFYWDWFYIIIIYAQIIPYSRLYRLVDLQWTNYWIEKSGEEIWSGGLTHNFLNDDDDWYTVRLLPLFFTFSLKEYFYSLVIHIMIYQSLLFHQAMSQKNILH